MPRHGNYYGERSGSYARSQKTQAGSMSMKCSFLPALTGSTAVKGTTCLLGPPTPPCQLYLRSEMYWIRFQVSCNARWLSHRIQGRGLPLLQVLLETSASGGGLNVYRPRRSSVVPTHIRGPVLPASGPIPGSLLPCCPLSAENGPSPPTPRDPGIGRGDGTA